MKMPSLSAGLKTACSGWLAWLVFPSLGVIMNHNISRRGFLTGTLAASAVGPLVLPAAVLGRGGQVPPSERITIGVIGVGNRGRHSLNAMRPLPDHQVVAIAEARRDRGESACQMTEEFYAERLGKTSYSGCKLYSDFRDVLARDDIDAIWGTVPDHWHGSLYSRVIESGKDIYGEKPLSRWIAQGVKLKKMVRQYGTIFQVGLQQRSDPKIPPGLQPGEKRLLGQDLRSAGRCSRWNGHSRRSTLRSAGRF